MKRIVLVLCVFGVIALLGLGVLREDARKAAIVPSPIQPTDYGNGVYVFFTTSGYDTYARSLAAFKEAHPELQCNTEQLSMYAHLLNCYPKDVDAAVPADRVTVE